MNEELKFSNIQAPEFLRGSPPSPRCDVYSLAILLWQLDTREVPFTGHHPQAVMYQVSSDWPRSVMLVSNWSVCSRLGPGE